MSEWRVSVEEDMMRVGVAILIGRHLGDTDQMVTHIGDKLEHVNVPPLEAYSGRIRIPHDIAMPLLDALSQYYGGVSDTRTLRNDYMAERARVDKLIMSLVHLAGGGRAQPQ